MLDDINELRTFVNVVAAGSLSAAAREMDLALSVVSKRLAALEIFGRADYDPVVVDQFPHDQLRTPRRSDPDDDIDSLFNQLDHPIR